MRWIFVVLCSLGLIASALALREHYRPADEISPCSINEKWDCGTVNRSRYAKMWHLPVAALGLGGYLFIGALAFKRQWIAVMASAIPSLIFSLYLANIEQNILEVWCIYCVASLSIISLISLLSLIVAAVHCFKPPTTAA